MNILLIEDSELVAKAFFRVLRKAGHEVTHVTGIGAAFDYISEGRKPDVVVTDRDVIGGDAWEFVLTAVREGFLPARVVFMSGRLPEVIPPSFLFKGSENINAKLLELVEAA